MAAKSATPEVMARQLAWLLFTAAFIAFAYFHQGGGWNPNGRFAMVRAIAEKGELSIDSYLVYERAKPDPSTELRRIQVHDAEFTVDGRTNVLVWMDAQGRPFPVNQILEGRVATVDASAKAIDIQIAKDANVTVSVTDATEIKQAQANLPFSAIGVGQVARVRSSLDQTGRAVAKNITLIDGDDLRDVTFTDFGIAAAGDVAFYQGHFYPNKAPGTSFIAVPAYWLVYHFEKIIGANPDEWWTLTLNAWLTSVLSVGLLSAVGVVLFYRLALAFSGGCAWASLLTAFTFAFGTMFFSYATSLYEHNIIAVGLIASFYLLYRVKTARASGNAVDAFTDKKRHSFFFSADCVRDTPPSPTTSSRSS